MSKTFKTAVYAGTGSKDAILSVFTHINAAQYVFIVANSEHVETIKKRNEKKTKQSKNITILEQYVSVKGDAQKYYQYNISACNGLRKASGLQDLFPSLKIKSSKLINTTSLNDLFVTLVNKNVLQGVCANYLFIDQAGESRSLAKTLKDDFLEYFHHIDMLEVADGLFEAEENATLIKENTKIDHFKSANPLVVSNDPDFPTFGFVMDRDKSELPRTQNKLARLEPESGALESAYEQLKRSHDELTDQNNKQARDIKYLRREVSNYKEQIHKLEVGSKNKDDPTFSQDRFELLERTIEEQEKTISDLNKQNKNLSWRILEHGDGFDSFIFHMEKLFYGKHITYVDAGAYDGSIALQVINSNLIVREAHLFEPNPESFKKLNTRVNKKDGENGCEFFLYSLALSDKESASRITLNKTMSRLIETDEELSTDSLHEIKTTTLDKARVAFTEEHISILKIDVEGHEMGVLGGAKKLLKDQSADVVYIEVGLNKDGKQQTYFRQVDDFLSAFGYRVYRIYEQQNEWMNDSPVLRRMNVAYISDKLANKAPVKMMEELNRLKRKLEET